MFSATKLVVAGAIVALFGGFLLSGVLTQQPSDDRLPAVGASASAATQAEPTDAATSEPEPTQEVEADDPPTNTGLLPGVDLVTEEVEPGVYRVLSDGVQHTLWPPRDIGPIRVVTPSDGSVWLGDAQEMTRLGDEGRYVGDAEIGPDGTVYSQIPEPTELRGFRPNLRVPLLAPDGTVWVQGTNKQDGPDQRSWLARRDAAGWERVAPPDPVVDNPKRGIESWGASEDGAVYAVEAGAGDRRGIFRYQDEQWERLTSPGENIGQMDVGADGSVWVHTYDDEASEGFVARLGDDGWTTHGLAAMWPDHLDVTYQRSAVGNDGALWFGLEHYGGCSGGLSRFDGSTLTTFLQDYCVLAVDLGPDGSAWVAAKPVQAVKNSDGVWVTTGHRPDDAPEDGLYVITPEAVAE